MYNINYMCVHIVLKGTGILLLGTSASQSSELMLLVMHLFLTFLRARIKLAAIEVGV